MGLRNKDLISIHDLSVGEVATILDVAKKLKRKQKRGEPHRYLEGKTLAMIFSKASTRTRVSFETGFYQLGGHPIYLNDSASQIGRGEPVRDMVDKHQRKIRIIFYINNIIKNIINICLQNIKWK